MTGKRRTGGAAPAVLLAMVAGIVVFWSGTAHADAGAVVFTMEESGQESRQMTIPHVFYRPGKYAFRNPTGIAVDSRGNVWVANAGSDSVTEILRKGGYRKKLTYGGPATHFDRPRDLAIDRLDDVWVVSRHGGTALYAKDRYRDPDYYSQRRYPVRFRERYVAVDPNAPWPVSLWITGSKRELLHVYGTPGKMRRTLYEIDDSTFWTPRKTLAGAAVDDRENLWLANRGGSLIAEHLKPTHGKLLGPTLATTFDNMTPDGKHVPFRHPPVLLAFDPKDNLWVSAPGTGRMTIYYAATHYTQADTFFNLNNPPMNSRGIAVDAKGTLWYTEHGNGLLSQKPARYSHDHYIGPKATTSYTLKDHGKRFHPRRIAIDDRGNVWMTGDEGVMRVNPPEVAPVRTPLLGQPKAP